MTIRSMPTNQNWYDNYDGIFRMKEEPKVLDLPPMYFFKADDEWCSAICRLDFGPPMLTNTNVYRVDQTYYKDMLMYEIQIVVDPEPSVFSERDIKELMEALEFCSNYGGAHHHG